MERSYNLRSPAVKRLMREAQELSEATYDYSAKPLDDNLFEWHFTFRGPEDSEYDGGFYHGRITLPPEYPMKPPSIMLLNPNGRFELNKKICLSISGYHPESWQPSWSIRTAILAIIGFLPTKGEGAIGSLDYTANERKLLARKSCSYSCPSCGLVSELLSTAPEVEGQAMDEKEKADRELAKQIVIAKPKDPTELVSEEPLKPSEVTELVESNTDVPDSYNLRQRTPIAAVSDVSVDQQGPVSTEPVPLSRRATQHNTETASMKLIIVLIAAIAILLLRRLDKSYKLI